MIFKKRKELLDRIIDLERESKMKTVRVDELKEELAKALTGGRCSGDHCAVCGNHTKVYKRGAFGALEEVVICKFDAALRCKDFKPITPPDEG